MRPPVLLLLPLLAACAGSDTGSWPSLAHRPGEPAAPRCGATPATAAPEAAPGATQLPPPAPDLAPIAAEADAICDRIESARPKWEAADVAAERAVRAARGAEPGTPAWGAAQIALTDLDTAAGPFRDAAVAATALAERLDELGVTDGDAAGRVARAVRLSTEQLARHEHRRIALESQLRY